MKNYILLNNEVTRKVNDFYQLDKDREAVQAFKEEIKEKTMTFESETDRISYLIKNDYYYNVCDQYAIHDIVSLQDEINAYNFEFQSFMAISKFFKDYALKTNDGKMYLESYEQHIVIVALYLSRGDLNKARKLAIKMIEQKYQPATPTFLNAGRARRGELVSCFLLSVDDDMNSIGHNINNSLTLSKMGGGVALNLTRLRGRGESIKDVANAGSGVVPVMKLLEDSFSYANQLGQRKGSGATYLSIFHSDIIEFLETKKINVDEKSRIQSLSIGLNVPHVFFELCRKDLTLYAFKPHTVYKAYGVRFDEIDMDKMYFKLVNDDRVEKVNLGSARDMLTTIACIQLESGYPYIMYETNANEQHALKDVGQIKMSNLCTEIFQLQETSEINDYGVGDVIKRDVSCNLGSLNIVNVMAGDNDLEETVSVAMDALTAVSDMSEVPVPSVKKANRELHSVGLGAMNLHGYFALNGIRYESVEALDFVNVFFAAINFYSIKRSMETAIELGQSFLGFERSEYAKGTYFEKYTKKDFLPETEKVQTLFAGHTLPTKEDWAELAELVKQNGMYHAYRLAIAPTQSISYIQNATSSIMPITQEIETRTYGNATTYYPAPFLSRKTYAFYMKKAYNMDMMKVIDLVAVAQQHIDQGISTILYVDNTIETSLLAKYYAYAEYKGLKSLYYTRVRNASIEECESCSI